MKTISIAARKGGVGKTTITYLITSYLAEILKKKILLIDADPQGNLSSMYDYDDNFTAELFSKKKINFNKIIQKTKFKEVDIISSNIDLDEVNNIIINANIKQKVLFKNLRSYYGELIKKYDYIFIDTNPSLSLINQNMLLISDEIILISDQGKYSVKGIMNLISDWNEICEDFDLPNNIRTIILNRLTNTSASKQIVEFMQKEFEGIVLNNSLKEYATIKNAINKNESLSKDKKLINLGNPIKKIVNELIQKGVV